MSVWISRCYRWWDRLWRLNALHGIHYQCILRVSIFVSKYRLVHLTSNPNEISDVESGAELQHQFYRMLHKKFSRCIVPNVISNLVVTEIVCFHVHYFPMIHWSSGSLVSLGCSIASTTCNCHSAPACKLVTVALIRLVVYLITEKMHGAG